jgi:hypothetical protein
MADTDIEQLIRTIRFGGQDERLSSILAVGDAKAPLERVRPYLLPLMDGETAGDDSEVTAAAISLAKLGDNSERVRATLLNSLQGFAANLKNMGIGSVDPDTPGVMMILQGRMAFGRQMVRGLAALKNDKVVVDGLLRIIQRTTTKGYSSLDEWMPRSLIDACLRGIGCVGHESGRELLEYWKDKGDLTASAALELFGGDWDAIGKRADELKNPPAQPEPRVAKGGFCPGCASPTPTGAAFCVKCGAKL